MKITCITYLQVSSLRHDPLMDELLRILCKAEEEFPVGFQLIDRVHCFVNLRVQPLNLLLTGRTQKEVVHLSLEGVINLRD